ncbi:P-type ATPase, partial [Reticulomyxa filosa]
HTHFYYCYLKRETNLKCKQVPEGFNTLPSFEAPEQNKEFIEKLRALLKDCEITCDTPSGVLDHWQGLIKHMNMSEDDEEKTKPVSETDIGSNSSSFTFVSKNVLLSMDNLLIRGSELRNSDWVYALVIYTGFDCKIFQNNRSEKFQQAKRSSVEKKMNRFIFMMVVIQFMVCVLCAVGSGVWMSGNSEAWYLDDSESVKSSAMIKFFTWFIIFAQLIPISLLVSMEMVKYVQALFMQWDTRMYVHLHGRQDVFCNVQNSGLNEELGQIQYVFSDKTGTLTENILEFRKCVIGNEQFGKGETEITRATKLKQLQYSDAAKGQNILPSSYVASRSNSVATMVLEKEDSVLGKHPDGDDSVMYFPHVNFDENTRLSQFLHDAVTNEKQGNSHMTSVQASLVRRFLTVLALNNSSFPFQDKHTQQNVIRASSPDDQCLAYFAKFIGVELVKKALPIVHLRLSFNNNVKKDDHSAITEQFVKWEQLAELEFTSKRKRMTTIFRNRKTKKIHVMTKGADSEMIKLLSSEKNPTLKFSEEQLDAYAEEGLRTLVIAEALKEESWWSDGWEKEFSQHQDEVAKRSEHEEGHVHGSCSDKCRICNFYDKVEVSAQVELLGVTAIEDKLQELVPDTIATMLQADIKVWMLTGDKQQTAENIAIACNLLEPKNPKELSKLMNNAICRVQNEKFKFQNAGMVVNSAALQQIMSDPDNSENDLKGKFLSLSTMCKSVIGVRLKPYQKAEVVHFIKTNTQCITMAVGDGSNDELMIRTANVGIGIVGLEGTAAVRASDYSIAKVKEKGRGGGKTEAEAKERRSYVLISLMFCNVVPISATINVCSWSASLLEDYHTDMLYVL